MQGVFGGIYLHMHTLPQCSRTQMCSPFPFSSIPKADRLLCCPGSFNALPTVLTSATPFGQGAPSFHFPQSYANSVTIIACYPASTRPLHATAFGIGAARLRLVIGKALEQEAIEGQSSWWETSLGAYRQCPLSSLCPSSLPPSLLSLQ
jgi:hypothetical protein